MCLKLSYAPGEWRKRERRRHQNEQTRRNSDNSRRQMTELMYWPSTFHSAKNSWREKRKTPRSLTDKFITKFSWSLITRYQSVSRASRAPYLGPLIGPLNPPLTCEINTDGAGFRTHAPQKPSALHAFATEGHNENCSLFLYSLSLKILEFPRKACY